MDHGPSKRIESLSPSSSNQNRNVLLLFHGVMKKGALVFQAELRMFVTAVAFKGFECRTLPIRHRLEMAMESPTPSSRSRISNSAIETQRRNGRSRKRKKPRRREAEEEGEEMWAYKQHSGGWVMEGGVEGVAYWKKRWWRENDNHEREQVRRQEAPQGQEVLVCLFPHCLGCGSPGAHDVVTKARILQGQIWKPTQERPPEGIIEAGPVLGGSEFIQIICVCRKLKSSSQSQVARDNQSLPKDEDYQHYEDQLAQLSCTHGIQGSLKLTAEGERYTCGRGYHGDFSGCIHTPVKLNCLGLQRTHQDRHHYESLFHFYDMYLSRIGEGKIHEKKMKSC
ncbi:hypothetical protein Vadar_020271 [Vaccinium darrowii]|uniref:Uncharacterized protein n=1 Tax=Vaccinium darrowii TaxID=229202 RepID=A0ACB7YQ97_9ERIC|nr:hypothetical protein Vadar_020271 [Vaccinium darrowii]